MKRLDVALHLVTSLPAFLIYLMMRQTNQSHMEPMKLSFIMKQGSVAKRKPGQKERGNKDKKNIKRL